MISKTIAFLALLLASASQANTIMPADRRAILDTVRPVAAAQAGQAVRIKVDRINEDGGWAVLVGELVSTRGTALDWSLAGNCHPDLDKMLWAVLRRHGGEWKVKHIEICTSEPPYWYLEQYGGFVWPCGVYAGLENGNDRDLEAQCREEQLSASKKRSPRPTLEDRYRKATTPSMDRWRQ